MARLSPYQPSLLRLLHGVSALLIFGSAISGYYVYVQFDGRWGRLGLLPMMNVMDEHKAIGEIMFLILLLFGLYSFTLGRSKLAQRAHFKQLMQPNRPSWWSSCQRFSNTFILGAVVLAALSGKRMESRWLANGDLNQLTYLVHLGAWGTIGIGLILHLLLNFKIGGMPLLLSIFSLRLRSNDTPKQWLG
jgi:hypothetical protein